MLSNDPVGPIRNRFLESKGRNPGYSMRAFARDLEISSGELSEILSGKRPLTKKKVEKLYNKIGVSPEVTRETCVKADGSPAFSGDFDGWQLAADEFNTIVEWYHFAILSLVKIQDFTPEAAWIGKRLGISTAEASSAIDRLVRLKLLKWQGTALVRTKKSVKTTTDIPSSALRFSHRQSLEQSIDALERIPVEEREICSLTMPIGKAEIPIAKRAIRRFINRFSKLSDPSNLTDVYNLNIQFIPLTKTQENQ